MESKLSRWCEGFIEAGWLLALIVTPLFFNIHSDRVFEPDKLTLLRSIALMMAVAWLVRFIDGRGWQDLSWLKWRSDNSIWRMPLVLPVFIVAVAYIISTLFSVAPRTSLWGSYQRLQGTYSTFAYIIVFATMASVMRTRAQIQRVITVIIVTSIPVALYGMLQKFQLDPLPWGGDTSRRIAGHMGNAIFIAAYLIMVVPLTCARIIDSFYNILTDEDLAYSDVIRSSIYILALALQFLAIYWTQSRGPLLGLALGMFAFALILLVALRNIARKDGERSSTDLVWPLVYVALGFVGLFASKMALGSLGNARSFYLFVGVLGALLLSVFVLAAAQVGWRWLWASWIGLLAFAGFVLIGLNIVGVYPETAKNIPVLSSFDETFESWIELPTIGRLARMIDSEKGNATVRFLIWEGAIELIRPHDPIVSPVSGPDKFNLIRPLIGYGPEAMYVAYNSFYPPELATVEARNASPDRSHNETFDALVITGAFGFVAWQVLYLTTFYFALSKLGVVRSKSERNLLIGFWIGGAVLATIIGVSIAGPVYMGVALPFGSVLGLILYLIYYALFSKGDSAETNPESSPYSFDTLIFVSLIAALVGYYIEIHFGIAIAATRVHSFAYMALIFVAGYKLTQGEEVVEEVRVRARDRSAGWVGPTVAATCIMAVVMITLGFDFVNFTPRPGELQGFQTLEDIPTASEILSRAMLENPRNDFAASPYLFGVVVFSWILGTLLMLTEAIRGGAWTIERMKPAKKDQKTLIAAGLFGLLALVMIWGGVSQLQADITTNTGRVGGMLAFLWAALSVAVAGSLALYPTSNPVRSYAGAIAAAGILFVLPVGFAGGLIFSLVLGTVSAIGLFLLWDSAWNTYLTPFITIGLGSYLMGYLYMLVHAGLLHNSFISPPAELGLTGSDQRVYEAARVGSYLARYYQTFFFLLIAGATAYAWSAFGRIKNAGWSVGFAALAVLFIVGFIVVDQTNLNVIQADMIYKRGKPFDQQAGQLSNQLQSAPEESRQQIAANVVDSWKTSIAIYEHAIDMVPNEDFYYLWLGRAYLEQANINGTERNDLLATASERLQEAQSINPLNTDHTANLARLNSRWAGYFDGDSAERVTRLDDAETYYQKALSLSPQNSIVRNEYGGLLLSVANDCDGSIDVFRESVQVDPYYARTYYTLADSLIRCGNRAGADELVDTNPSELPDAIRDERVSYYVEAQEVLEGARDLQSHRGQNRDDILAQVARIEASIASQYFSIGEYERAMASTDIAREAAPNNLIPEIDQLVELIRTQQSGQ